MGFYGKACHYNENTSDNPCQIRVLWVFSRHRVLASLRATVVVSIVRYHLCGVTVLVLSAVIVACGFRSDNS